MKKITVVAAIVSSLALNACGKTTSSEDSETTAASGGNINFNLGEHLQKSGAKSSAKGVNFGSNGLSIGGPSNFLLDNNVVVKSQNQKLSAQYYTDVTVLRKKLPGHAIDLTASANAGDRDAQVNFRILGQSLYSVKKSNPMNQSFTRDIGVTIPYPILPALSVDLGGSVGGEVGFSVSPGLASDNRSLKVIFDPEANLNGKIKAGVSVLFARAEAKGTVKVIQARMPVTTSIGAANQVQVDPLAINLLAGKIDLNASLSFGNILPGPAAQLWKKVFGKGLEYTYPLVAYDGIPVLRTGGKTYQY